MIRRERLRSLAVAGREMLSVARQALLLPRDTLSVSLPHGAEDGDDVVVFLHGLFSSAGALRPLRAAVAKHPGVHAAALTYPPGPGITELSDRLGAVLAALPAGVAVHLVGHSLGGIVARYYVVERTDARIVQTISLASPFGGVPGAALLGFTRDLHPSSPLLRSAALGVPRSGAVPHLSIIGGADAIVRSPRSHALSSGEVVVFDRCGHNTLLYDEAVARLVTSRVVRKRLGRVRAGARRGPPGVFAPGKDAEESAARARAESTS